MSFTVAYPIYGNKPRPITLSPSLAAPYDMDFGKLGGWSVVLSNQTAITWIVQAGNGTKALPAWVHDRVDIDGASAAQATLVAQAVGPSVAGEVLATYYTGTEQKPGGYPMVGVQQSFAGTRPALWSDLDKDFGLWSVLDASWQVWGDIDGFQVPGVTQPTRGANWSDLDGLFGTWADVDASFAAWANIIDLQLIGP